MRPTLAVSLTAALHASVAVSALVAYLHPGAEVLESTIGSYGAIAASPSSSPA